MKTFIEVAFEIIVCAVLVIGMVTIFVGAVLQESYKNYPPTAEEIAENPELVRYTKWDYEKEVRNVRIWEQCGKKRIRELSIILKNWYNSIA